MRFITLSDRHERHISLWWIGSFWKFVVYVHYFLPSIILWFICSNYECECPHKFHCGASMVCTLLSANNISHFTDTNWSHLFSPGLSDLCPSENFSPKLWSNFARSERLYKDNIRARILLIVAMFWWDRYFLMRLTAQPLSCREFINFSAAWLDVRECSLHFFTQPQRAHGVQSAKGNEMCVQRKKKEQKWAGGGETELLLAEGSCEQWFLT